MGGTSTTFKIIAVWLCALLVIGLGLLFFALTTPGTLTSEQNVTHDCYVIPEGWEAIGVTDQYSGYAQLYIASDEGDLVKSVKFADLPKVEC